ncbi:Hypothetical protein ORPV_318 [Orpheovirus IHUMI-LCC2]|uniref:Uncharacterized protein n=1 Tax=Orpheovirus IHUMI-LCC2 TaxID=2023057 RepID=A0A2I2L3U7_9VIRU|nr:Hypothetical protein ORPV_318 [Orpheovirus IHUMI-LCC2]SNW62222.1 Hypothetical protein ORPV_318 [Orpheovirus IHUMI-LCC2]
MTDCVLDCPFEEKKVDVDPWHYVGCPNWHKCEYAKPFIDLCKDKLPNQKLPIRVGWTGYIELNSLPEKGTFAWCHDDVGRFVCLIDDVLVFQRMQNGDLLMYGRVTNTYSSFSDQATLDILDNLRETILNRYP